LKRSTTVKKNLNFLYFVTSLWLQYFFLSGRGKAAAAADNSKAVVRRFVRSIARLFVVLSIETPPSQNKKKSPAAAVQPLQRCKRAFQVRVLAESSVADPC
jgi:hypothetical protein